MEQLIIFCIENYIFILLLYYYFCVLRKREKIIYNLILRNNYQNNFRMFYVKGNNGIINNFLFSITHTYI